MQHYHTLTQKFARISSLQDASSILNWDANVLMPAPAASYRADQLAAIEASIIDLVNDPANLDLINAVKNESLSEVEIANLSEIEYMVQSSLAVEPSLKIEYEREKLNTEILWRKAKSQNNFNIVEKALSSLFDLNLQIAAAKADKFNISPYQVMINDSDRGLEEQNLDLIFDNILSDIPPLLSKKAKDSSAKGLFMEKQDQMKLASELVKIMGLKTDQLMINESLHPFCGGNPYDNRITVFYLENNPVQTILALVHEAGHALYEQNLPQELLGQPAGKIRGMAIHESQSLFFEKHVTSSKEFCTWLAQFITTILPNYNFTPKALYREVNSTNPTLIRIFADELSYPVHVAIRYLIEKKLVSKEIAISDIPEIWDNMYEKYLGIRPGKQSEGCLQDIHWYCGSFGYFPSYTAGAIIASMIEEKLKTTIPDFSARLASADFKEINLWLKDNIHRKASTLPLQTILRQATGKDLDYGCYFKYLSNKFCNH